MYLGIPDEQIRTAVIMITILEAIIIITVNQPTVEKHMRVYISRNGKCYHRQFGCSEATKPIHLFIAAQKYAPCERCIPYKARKYKVPDWYFEFLKLVDQYSKEVQQLESKN